MTGEARATPPTRSESARVPPHAKGLRSSALRAFTPERSWIFVLCLIDALTPATAYAGGFEVPAPGTRGLGRGGAFAARADDGLALELDPAGLAWLAGPAATLDVHAIFHDACVQRSGTYRDDVSRDDYSRFGFHGDYADEPFVEVCGEGRPAITPWILFAMPIGDRLGVGGGIVSPVGHGPARWGNADGTIRNEAGELRPTPTRYAYVDANAFRFGIDLGAGYRLLDWLSLGLTFHWGIARSAKIVTYTHPLTSADGPSYDARSELRNVNDFFLPGFVVSAHARPIPELDAVVAFSWLDSFRGEGTATIGWGDFSAGTRDEPGTLETQTEIEGMRLRVPQPMKLRAAVRWADVRPSGPSHRTGLGTPRRDPMLDERWDVELDAVWEMNSRIDAFIATPPDGARFEAAWIQDGRDVRIPIPVPQSVVEKNWRDQLTLHLGGDVNLLPGSLALRAGVSFETRGGDPAHLIQDFMPMQRLGLHAGATLRLGDVDVSVAYAHVFQETVVVSSEQARFEQLGDGVGEIVNAGEYRASWNLVSLGATWRP